MRKGPKGIRVNISPSVKQNGEVKSWYPSMMECARQLGLQESHISECCSGKRKQHKGFIFTKADDNGGYNE